MPELLTGYGQFDTITGGLQQADVLTVATSPPGDGVGLALSIALNVASARRHRVGLFALSLNRHRTSQCLLAMRAGILQHQYAPDG
jgi:replicative DNA helicase